MESVQYALRRTSVWYELSINTVSFKECFCLSLYSLLVIRPIGSENHSTWICNFTPYVVRTLSSFLYLNDNVTPQLLYRRYVPSRIWSVTTFAFSATPSLQHCNCGLVKRFFPSGFVWLCHPTLEVSTLWLAEVFVVAGFKTRWIALSCMSSSANVASFEIS